MKTCTKCGQPKPPDRFAVDRAKRDGRDSWCRDCRNRARMDRYNARLDHERQRSRDYYAGHRDERRRYYESLGPERRAVRSAAERFRYRSNPAYRAKKNAYRQAYNPVQGRLNYMKRHGGIDEWARLYDAQNGLCYLCGQTLEGVPQRLIAVDHDHDCCPGGKVTESCSACRRGLAHAWCNQLIGMAGEDMDVLRAIIVNFERVNELTKQRITAKQHQQLGLELFIA